MSYYPNQSLDLMDLLEVAFKRYWGVLTKSIPLMACFMIAQVCVTFPHFLQIQSIDAVLYAFGGLFFLFFISAFLIQVNSILVQAPLSSRESCRQALSRFMLVLITIAVFLGFLWSYFFLVRYSLQHVDHTLKFFSVVPIFFFVLGMLLIVFLLFSLPLVILDNLSPLQAIWRSYSLVRPYAIKVFTVYAAIGFLVLLVLPSTQHAHFFMRYHLFLLFTFFAYVIVLPFVGNYVLLILNDLKVRFYE